MSELVDLCSIPLTDKQIAQFAKMRVRMYHDDKSGKSFLSRSYCDSLPDPLRRALVTMVTSHE